jgi:tetratricopeptide (TPR) repeat protein
MMKSAQKTIYAVAATALFVACKTTAPVVRVNEDKQEIKVYSSDQKASSLSKSANHKSLQEAANVLEQKLKKNPRDVQTLLDLAQIHLVKGEHEKARASCQKALSYDLQNKRGAKLLAEVELARNNLRKAEIILYRIGGDKSKDSEVLNLLGLIALKRGENDNAFGLFKSGLKTDPDNAALRMNIGTLHMKYKQIKQAAAQFERVLRTIPDHSDAMLHLGVAKAYFGKNKEAEELYQKVLDQDSSNVIARYNLSLVQEKMGQLQESLANVGKALASNDLTQEQKKQAVEHQAQLKAEIKKREDEERRRKEQEREQAKDGKSMAAKPLKSDKRPPEEKQR